MGYQNRADGHDLSERALTPLPALGLVVAVSFSAGPG